MFISALTSLLILPSARPQTAGKQGIAHIPRFKVLLHNDDVNTMEHVVKTLIKVFRFGRLHSEQIMFEAHKKGLALCVVEPLEQAELHRDQLESFSLIATIEQE